MMDSDFMNNLANMIKSGNIPDDIKEKMNRIYESKLTDKILIIQSKLGNQTDNSSNETRNF